MKTKTINGITYTHRTREGLPARIICTDRVAEKFKIMALVLNHNGEEYVASYRENLSYFGDGSSSRHDLFEGVEPEPDWSKVEIDTKVFVRDSDDKTWLPRHFAGVKGSHFCTWISGTTSFTADGNRILWLQMKLAEEK